MSDPTPQPFVPKSSTQSNEVAIATSFSDVQRFYQLKQLKVSKNSPPTVVDVNECELILDKTAGKLYTKINGVVVGVALT